MPAAACCRTYAPEAVDLSIAALLTQDGITNGAIYALLALALVLVFTVTRIIWVPSGEFVAWGTLTLAGLQLGKPTGIIWLLLGMAVIAGAMECWDAVRKGEQQRLPRRLALWFGVPAGHRRRCCGGSRRCSCRCRCRCC